MTEFGTRRLIPLEIIRYNWTSIYKLEENVLIDPRWNWRIQVLEFLALAPFRTADKIILS